MAYLVHKAGQRVSVVSSASSERANRVPWFTSSPTHHFKRRHVLHTNIHVYLCASLFERVHIAIDFEEDCFSSTDRGDNDITAHTSSSSALTRQSLCPRDAIPRLDPHGLSNNYYEPPTPCQYLCIASESLESTSIILYRRRHLRRSRFAPRDTELTDVFQYESRIPGE